MLPKERTLITTCFTALTLLLVLGTVLFHLIENWSLLDAFYFTGMTMLTVGYGDIAPHTPAGKVTAVIFAFASVGVALYSINVLARATLRQRVEKWHKI